LHEHDSTGFTAAGFCLDSAEDWKMAPPVAGMFDSRQEKVAFEIKLDQPGEHLLALRFEDACGNTAYRNLTIILPE
jgi:hypothetical protein